MILDSVRIGYRWRTGQFLEARGAVPERGVGGVAPLINLYTCGGHILRGVGKVSESNICVGGGVRGVQSGGVGKENTKLNGDNLRK